MTRSAERSTVVVAGAGPVGLAVAAGLLTGSCANSLCVHVVDAAPAPAWDPQSMDPRVYALSRASQRILDSLGAWRGVAASRVSPYRRMRVWEGERYDASAAICFDSADVGEPDLGHIVEDGLIRRELLEVVASAAGGRFTAQAAIRTLDVRPDGVEIELAGGERISGAVLIAADGVRSPIRSMLDMPVIERSYRQSALVTHVATERPHDETAYQRFLTGGPLAFLPLADGRSSVVWSLSAERAAALRAAPDSKFLAELQAASGGMLGSIGEPAERACFGLRLLHAVRYCRPRVAFAGDAVHSVHPLAGQGMNLGLLDAACLVEEIERGRREGQALGDLPALRRYERRRKGDNLRMLLALDAVERLFTLPGWAVPLRAVGLSAVDCTRPLKRALIRRALRPHWPLPRGGTTPQTPTFTARGR